MRFRAKFGAAHFIQAGIAAFFLVFWIGGRRHETGAFIIPIVLLALQQISSHFFIYWDVESDHLHERRFWKTTNVAWSEITHIGYLGKTSQLSIDHRRNAPMSDSGRIIANPEDQSEFINAIRRFAPQAAIEA